jgi:hypothetical protein
MYIQMFLKYMYISMSITTWTFEQLLGNWYKKNGWWITKTHNLALFGAKLSKPLTY